MQAGKDRISGMAFALRQMVMEMLLDGVCYDRIREALAARGVAAEDLPRDPTFRAYRQTWEYETYHAMHLQALTMPEEPAALAALLESQAQQIEARLQAVLLTTLGTKELAVEQVVALMQVQERRRWRELGEDRLALQDRKLAQTDSGRGDAMLVQASLCYAQMPRLDCLYDKEAVARIADDMHDRALALNHRPQASPTAMAVQASEAKTRGKSTKVSESQGGSPVARTEVVLPVAAAAPPSVEAETVVGPMPSAEAAPERGGAFAALLATMATAAEAAEEAEEAEEADGPPVADAGQAPSADVSEPLGAEEPLGDQPPSDLLGVLGRYVGALDAFAQKGAGR